MMMTKRDQSDEDTWRSMQFLKKDIAWMKANNDYDEDEGKMIYDEAISGESNLLRSFKKDVIVQ